MIPTMTRHVRLFVFYHLLVTANHRDVSSGGRGMSQPQLAAGNCGPQEESQLDWGMGVTLSSPITEKNSTFVENASYRVGVSSMQGWRVTMEDAHAVHLEMPGDPMAAFFAVYDGHGGPSIAEYAGAHLDKFITSQESYKNGNVVTAIERAFMDIDSKMREDKSLLEEMSGSTANVVLIRNRIVYCGNAGDSRAIAFVRNKTMALSVDHKPIDPKEYKRITDAGGWVDANRVNGNLAVSRALGDFPFKTASHKPADEQQVIAFPDVRKEPLTDDWRFIVLACDGIWDVMSSEEVGDFVNARLSAGSRPDIVCEELMTNCLATDVSGSQAGCDNMTVIIVEIVGSRKSIHSNEGQGGWCLRDVVMWAPEMVRAGTTLQLGCDYDLEGSALYSIKFYQGDQEFYRYVPKEAPPTRVFPLPGIQVDVYQSNATVVTLNNVQKEMTGLYKCEVSADAPFFHTVIRSSNLVVIEKPVTVPEILVEKLKYSMGEKIRANCTSRSSYPAANLTFYVNNVPLRSSDLTKLYWYVKSERGGLETSLLELETTAVPSMFVEGRFRLRCIATQYTLYRKAADVWLQEDMPQLAHVLGPSHPNPESGESSSSSVHPSSTWISCLVLFIAIAIARR